MPRSTNFTPTAHYSPPALSSHTAMRYGAIMLVGILSDSHGDAVMVAAALAMLHARGAQHFIHCGDIGSEGVLDRFAGLPTTFVTGNTDYDRDDLLRYGQQIGLQGYIPLADLTLDGKRMAIVHGDDAKLLQRLITSQDYDYVLHGHTHQRRETRSGRTLVINPGALHRAAEKTAALLDTATGFVEFLVTRIEIPRKKM